MFKPKELKQLIKKATEDITREYNQKQKLLNQDMNYQFLSHLLEQVDADPNLTITIHLKSGDRMIIQRKTDTTNPWNNFDGNPIPSEIDL